MLYFKNRELAETYHVSDRTIRNWVDETKRGKLDLTLHEQSGRSYIANTPQNLEIIEGLVAARKKFRPHHTFKVITPKREFYRLYTPPQVYDILTNLEIHREIPHKYNYFDGGAGNWDTYARRLAIDEHPNSITASMELLHETRGYLDGLLANYTHVNVVDIGGGNALPVKDFLEHLRERGVMGRYIDIDISASMLDVAGRNIKKWFNKEVSFEGYELDINYDRFANILAGEYLKADAEDTINIVLLLGGTLANFRAPDGALRVIHDSMGIKDLLIYTKKLDSEMSRRFFDFNPKPGEVSLPPLHGFVLKMLNIDTSLYEREAGYDPALNQRYEQIRLKMAITLKFEFDEGEKYVNFNKGDTILVWRALQQGALDIIHQFDRNDFYMLHSSQMEDQQYMLMVSQVKSEQHPRPQKLDN